MHDAIGRRPLVEVTQHQHGGQQQRRRIREILAGDVWRAAVDRLEHGDPAPQIGGSHDPEPPDEPRAEIGDDVAVQVRHHEHIELRRVQDQLHARGVDDPLIVLDVRRGPRDLTRALEKEPVAELHDVRLVNGGDSLAPVSPRVGERKLHDPRRCALGDDLQALDHARHHLMLEACIEILGVLAHDDQVDPGIPRVDPGQVPHRAEVGVEVERLAQPDVDAREPFRDRGGHRALQRDLVAADGVDELDRQRGAPALEREHAGEMALPCDRDAGRVEDAEHRIGHLGADAVARNQGHGVKHKDLVIG